MKQNENIQSILKRHPKVSFKRANELALNLAGRTAAAKLYFLKVFKTNNIPEHEIVFVEELIGVRDPEPEPEPEQEPELKKKTTKRSKN